MATSQARVAVRKTYKLFIGGAFPRTESGRFYTHAGHHLCLGSRKDVRDAVVAARTALPSWQNAKAGLRGQILYRIAEMLETRKAALIEELLATTKTTRASATQEVEQNIDRTVWYAGWCDKFAQVFGTVNPVSAPYFNFSFPEATGVVGVVLPPGPALTTLIAMLMPVLVAGNTAIVLPQSAHGPLAITVAECLATADLPAGVVNIITGDPTELTPILASHLDVNAIVAVNADDATRTLLQTEGAANCKRLVLRDVSTRGWREDRTLNNPLWIADTCEVKTVWHPIGV